MPAISNFEDRLMEFMATQDKNGEMIRRLDEVLCNKADRMTITELRAEIEKSYATRTE